MDSQPGDGWPEPAALAWVSGSLGGVQVHTSRRLIGGLTADMFRLSLDVGRDDVGRDVVLRCYRSTADWARSAVHRETQGLTALATSGLPVPRLLAATPDTASPLMTLTSLLPGEVVLVADDPQVWLAQLAGMLVRIHDVPVELEADPIRFDPDRVDLDWIGDPGLARAALEIATADQGQGPSGLVHGDYQHFNVLWTDRCVSGVVDWTEVGVGLRGHDVGHCRLNLAVLYSAAAAERFLSCYESEIGGRVEPGPDLRKLLDFDPAWQNFIPLQVASRAPVDPAGMPDRVRTVLRTAVSRAG